MVSFLLDQFDICNNNNAYKYFFRFSDIHMAKQSDCEKSVMKKRYFNMEDAINSPIKSRTVFIIANERLTKDNRVGRYYTVISII